MYITNIRHLLDASEKMAAEMPKEPRELFGFLTLVVDTTTKSLPHSLTTSNIRCFEKGCHGFIKTALMPKNAEIHWYCPDCEAEGIIGGWQGTEWDNTPEGK
jgi:hypothetical protein